jgi:hypothetical protein
MTLTGLNDLKKAAETLPFLVVVMAMNLSKRTATGILAAPK